MQTVVVCEVQVPFVQGGAESHVRALVAQLRARGYVTDIVRLPFKGHPREEILAHAAAWRLLDLTQGGGRPIDLVIGTKFPSYFARHPNKVVWLIHQHRPAYELCGTPYSDFTHTEQDVAVRARLIELDTRMLGECKRVFTNARNTAERLARFNGLHGKPLYHPPPLAEAIRPGPYGSYALSVGRLEAVKRIELPIAAMRWVDPSIRLVVVGEGSQRQNLTELAERAGVTDRVAFAGEVRDQELLDLYAGALTVIYPPYDEDYGYVTLEAFLARKPVITATDSGGTLEFVEDGVNGFVCPPEPEAIAAAINRLGADLARAASLGDAGFERARSVTWEGVIEKLVGE